MIGKAAGKFTVTTLNNNKYFKIENPHFHDEWVEFTHFERTVRIPKSAIESIEEVIEKPQ